MTSINASALKIENPYLNKSSCMKIALKELKKEKDMRNYIRTRSIQMRKENSNITIASSIKIALSEWKTNILVK